MREVRTGALDCNGTMAVSWCRWRHAAQCMPQQGLGMIHQRARESVRLFPRE